LPKSCQTRDKLPVSEARKPAKYKEKGHLGGVLWYPAATYILKQNKTNTA
jgi:hypothetical protein